MGDIKNNSSTNNIIPITIQAAGPVRGVELRFEGYVEVSPREELSS